MEIKEFKEQYGISDATPQSPTLQVMSADGFSEAAARRVYAISTQDSRRIMLGKLHEIILIPEIFFAKGRK